MAKTCGPFQVRHPNILSFLHSTEVEADGSGSKHAIYIVTEPVMPLSEKIKELGLEGAQRYFGRPSHFMILHLADMYLIFLLTKIFMMIVYECLISISRPSPVQGGNFTFCLTSK